MENKIQHTVILLKQLNDIVEKYRCDNSFSLDDMQLVVTATRECSDTNSLIEYAEYAAHEDVEQLMSDCKTLLDETQSFLSLYDELNDYVKFIRFNTKPLCDEHIRMYKEEWDAQCAVTLTLWREYCQMSNRLDMMDMSDPDFAELDKLCDQKKADHDKSKAKGDTLYNIYREKERAEIGANYVDISYINVIMSRIGQIAECIITDINNLKMQEGDVWQK